MSLALIKWHAINNCVGMEIYLHTFLIFVLHETMWLISRPAPLYPRGGGINMNLGGHQSRPGQFGEQTVLCDFAANRSTAARTYFS